MKLLVISFNYYPLVNPRSLRVTALCEEWARLGNEVHIVCTQVSGAKLCELKSNVHIHRVGPSEESTQAGSVKESVWKKILRPIYRATLKKLIWPDSNFRWIKPATDFCLQLEREHDFDYVLSVSHPFTSHVVGHTFIDKLDKDKNWFMDSGDPFAFIDGVNINNSFMFSKKNYKFEQACLSKCKHSFVTTAQTKALYEENFNIDKTKTSVIGPLLRDGFSFSPSASINKWFFAGTLYKHIRNPRLALKAFVEFLKSNPEAEFHFYGSINDCRSEFDLYSQYLGKKILLHGLVKSSELKEKINQADLLINIGNNTKYQLPSKVIEYIALGKPVLNFTSVKEDSSSELLNNYPLALNHHSSESLTSLLLGLESLRANLSLDESLVKNLCENYRIKNISQAYLAKMNEFSG